ncbi:MAG: cysteine dioxygenase family protein [Phycisphaerae bacterium]|nr:cysteine dioxygenase family protein [Phycisphaerae bacterium]
MNQDAQRPALQDLLDGVGSLSLSELIDRLDSFSEAERVPAEVLQPLLNRLEVTTQDLGEAISFSEDHYLRNRVRVGSNYEVLVLCWKSGQQSPIHDHGGSNCAVRVVQGAATEVQFQQRDDGKLVVNKVGRLTPGRITQVDEDDLHLVANREAEGVNLVTLHVYSPAIVESKKYDLGGVVGDLPW